MADYTAILTPVISNSNGASIQSRSTISVTNSLAINGTFSPFTASLGISISVPTVQILSPQTTGQLFP